MKHRLSQMALILALIATLAFLFGGTASAHSTVPTARTRTTAASVALACPPQVQEGSSGPVVKTLQSALNELYRDFDDPSFYEMSPDPFHFPLAVDGSFGPQTLAAVIDFQSWNPIGVDGQVGPMTWHALHKC